MPEPTDDPLPGPALPEGTSPAGLDLRPDAETAPARTFPHAEAAWATIRASQRRRMLLPTLLLMTLATGIIDAVSYLALGSVFTANMTGNVVLVGFAFGGVPGFSISRTLTAVAAFALGSALAGRLSRHWRRHPFIWMRRTTAIEIVLLTVAALGSIGLVAGIDVDDEPRRYAVIAVLALAMGMRNGTVRRLGFTDVPTTVLTSTITDLASDSRLGGGERRRQGRRATAIAAMTLGAVIGALLVREVDPLVGFAAAIALLVAAATHQATTARRYPVRRNAPDPAASADTLAGHVSPRESDLMSGSNQFKVERSTTIAAPASAIYPHIVDFSAWRTWSPWEDVDPSLERTYSDPTGGEGASYSWSGNRKAGSGRMTITDATAPENVTIRLEFLKPFKATNIATFTLHESGASTVVTWTMTGPKTVASRIMSVFGGLDKIVGKDFEKGLAALKDVAEARR